MEYRFIADEWQKFAPKEQARRSRLLAAEAQELAGRASDELRPVYLELAVVWLTLARKVESEAAKRRT